MTNISDLLERNTKDPRVRLELGQELLDALEQYKLPSDSTVLSTFCDLVVQWFNGSNFKVALLALEIIDAALDVSGDVLGPYLLENITSLMERLGDNKEQVRQTTLDLILKLMSVPRCSPQIVVEKMIGGFTHKQWLVRVGAMQVVQNTLRTFGGNSLHQSKIVPLVCKLAEDPNSQVRDTAGDTLVEIYIFTGDCFIADLQRQRLIPMQKLPAILQRFKEAKNAGLVDSNGEPMAETGNDRVVANYRKEHRQCASSVDFVSARMHSLNRGKHRQQEFDDERENVHASGVSTNEKSWSRARSVPAHKRISVTARYSSSAGAVNEEQFNSAFTDVPKIEIYSGKELVIQMGQIRDVMSNTNTDWNKRVESLRKLRSFLVGGATEYAEFLIELKFFEGHLQAAVRDLRSQVVREACITIAFYADTLELKLEHLAESIFESLLNLIQNSAKVVSTSGLLTCRHIIRNVRTPKLVPIVIGGLLSKSREIRRSCLDLLSTIISYWESSTIEKNMSHLMDAVKSGLNDADLETRAASRRAYRELAQRFRDRADVIFQSLDAKKQRQLVDEMTRSSTGPNIGPLKGYGETFRSTSDIDMGAARRAMLRYSPDGKAKVPLQPRNSLQRPHRLAVGTTTTLRVNTARQSVRTPSKSVSQPGSRSGSPTSRLTLGTKSKQRTPASGRALREPSPNRPLYGRRISMENSRNNTPNREMERVLYDVLKVRGNGSNALFEDMDDNGSQDSDRSLNRLESAELIDAVRLCQSSQWTEKREGLTHLQTMFRSGGRQLCPVELRKLCDCFSRMFVDQNNKAFSLFLDTLVDFLAVYRSDLRDWLYVLLTRLLTKSGNDLLASVQNKIHKTLTVVRESFPYHVQFHILCRYVQDPLHTPSLKVKVALLQYMHDLLIRMDPGAFSNTAEIRLAMSKIIIWVIEPKSADVRRSSQEVLLALFNLNASEFTAILATYSKQAQDTVYSLLKSNAKRHSTPKRTDPVSSTSSFDMGQVHDRLRETSAQINQYVFGEGVNPEKGKGGSQDSGIVDAVDGFMVMTTMHSCLHHLLDYSKRSEELHRPLNSLSLTAGDERQQEIIADICQELSNHNWRPAERVKAMNAMKQLARDGSFTLWNEHFKTILLLLIETLGDKETDVRAHALRVLKEICLSQATRFRDYAELTVLRVLEAHKDGEKDVVRAAEECATVLASHLPPHFCLRVLNPVICGQEGSAKLLAAVKMITKVINQLGPDEICTILPDVVPGVVAAYESDDSSVRKASVLCLVALNNAVGEESLRQYLSNLNPSKITLLQLYTRRAQSSSGHI